MKKRNMRQIELVGKGRLVTLKHGHAFNVKPGFLIVKTYRNTYVVTFINDCSARLYQGTAGGGIVRVDIDPREFARRFNIAENFMWETIVPKMRERIWEWQSETSWLNKSRAIALDAVKKYSIDDVVADQYIRITDAIVPTSWEESYSEFFCIERGVYEHICSCGDGDAECGFVVLTKNRLEKLREAEAQLYAAADADCEITDATCEITIDININYVDFFREEPSEGFRYKHPESFENYVLKNVPMWRKPVEKLPPHWWRETLDTDTEE